MNRAATRRKLANLEAQLEHLLTTCQIVALRQLTDDELEHFAAAFDTHRTRIERIDVLAVPAMARPAWVPPAQWAALHRYARLYTQAYYDHTRNNDDERREATYPPP
jgi:hypothetical protein